MLNTVDNGRHGFSLGYKHGAFLLSFLIKMFVKQGRLVLHSVIFWQALHEHFITFE
jgi:hypothetical protein